MAERTLPAPADLTVAMPLSAPKLPTIDHAIGLPPGGTAPVHPSWRINQHEYLARTGYDSREEHLADILRDIEGGR